VPPEQRNVYQHFDLTEEEIRIIKHQSNIRSSASASASAAATEGEGTEGELEGGAHPALREAPASSSSSSAAAAAAAGASGRPAPSSLLHHPLASTLPLKLEVKAELTELEQVLRAQEQMKQIQAEEEGILQRQLAALEQPQKKL
jgi:hypothetical protein